MKPLRVTIPLALSLTLVLSGCSKSDSTDPETGPIERATPDASRLELAVADSERQLGIMSPASCVAGITWNHRSYVIISGPADGVPKDPQPAEALDGAVLPGCNDTGGTLEPDIAVESWAIEGVDPRFAILVNFP